MASVRVGATRPMSSGGTAPPRRCAQWTCDRLHLRAVPGHDDAGEQAQGVGKGLHLLGTLGVVARDSAGVDGSLQSVDGFAAKRVIEAVVAHKL
jgi:hypothetical protein